MKSFICLICVLSIRAAVSAQVQSIEITVDKTTSLIFPHRICHVDRGSRDILVQPVSEADNILLIKAADRNFPPTNLSVLTADGSLYSIAVHYGDTTVWVYRFAVQKKTSIATYAGSILDNPGTVRGIRGTSWNVMAVVRGIYIKDGVIYFQLGLENKSSIDYDIDFLRFYIRDKKKAKRTAIQERELKPLFIAGNTMQVRAGSLNAIVFAFDKFTIPDAKYLAIEIGEKNGGRQFLLKVSNRKLIKATALPDFISGVSVPVQVK